MNETMNEYRDHIYETGDTGKVSRKQEMPKTSLDLFILLAYRTVQKLLMLEEEIQEL
jgi:hypothetical protein